MSDIDFAGEGSDPFVQMVRPYEPAIVAKRGAWGCGPGWLPLIGDFLAAAAKILSPQRGELTIHQIEAHMASGTLDISFTVDRGDDDATRQLTALGQALSEKSKGVCETCGAPGAHIMTPAGFGFVACRDHAPTIDGKRDGAFRGNKR